MLEWKENVNTFFQTSHFWQRVGTQLLLKKYLVKKIFNRAPSFQHLAFLQEVPMNWIMVLWFVTESEN